MICLQLFHNLSRRAVAITEKPQQSLCNSLLSCAKARSTLARRADDCGSDEAQVTEARYPVVKHSASRRHALCSRNEALVAVALMADEINHRQARDRNAELAELAQRGILQDSGISRAANEPLSCRGIRAYRRRKSLTQTRVC
ncbi:hypothetical protein BDV96DRAFT_199162 [Lophiotrema nucula]|uniref:Uncharacterized protein n=1 Tax=Lophiotrema nucula TaxID=690887 RepID=A0A6A5YW12_9PLEO|nr:hypothetical protein BDV96DRAFT_199162 [Lophiotrema nucula]